MRVRDLYGDVSNTLGKCDEATVFRRLSDAVRLLANKGLFDANVAFMDIRTEEGTITLPPEVDTVLAVNVSCRPTLVRDEWFQYHLNGIGSELKSDCGYTDVLSQNTPVVRALVAPVKLVARPRSVTDNNKTLRVFGWTEDGERIYSTEDGRTVDGFLVPVVFGFPQVNPDAPAIARIDRVEKATTNDYVELVAVNPLATATELYRLGLYGPWERDPSYRRIRISTRQNNTEGAEIQAVRIAYKKKTTEIRSLDDWINLDNREALLLAVKAVKFRDANNPEQARAFESEAQRLLSEEAESKRPTNALSGPQIMREDEWGCRTDSLFY